MQQILYSTFATVFSGVRRIVTVYGHSLFQLEDLRPSSWSLQNAASAVYYQFWRVFTFLTCLSSGKVIQIYRWDFVKLPNLENLR